MIIVKWGEKLQVAEFGGMNIHNNYHLLIRIRFSPTWIQMISYTLFILLYPHATPITTILSGWWFKKSKNEPIQIILGAALGVISG